MVVSEAGLPTSDRPEFPERDRTEFLELTALISVSTVTDGFRAAAPKPQSNTRAFRLVRMGSFDAFNGGASMSRPTKPSARVTRVTRATPMKRGGRSKIVRAGSRPRGRITMRQMDTDAGNVAFELLGAITGGGSLGMMAATSSKVTLELVQVKDVIGYVIKDAGGIVAKTLLGAKASAVGAPATQLAMALAGGWANLAVGVCAGIIGILAFLALKRLLKKWVREMLTERELLPADRRYLAASYQICR